MENIIDKTCLYVRDGWPDVKIVLSPDGTIKNSPGHGEHYWEYKNKTLFLYDVEKNCSAVLTQSSDIFVGKLFGRVSISIRKYVPLKEYVFPENIQSKLNHIRESESFRYLFGIPYTLKFDLLNNAINSLGEFANKVFVIDNSPMSELRNRKLDKEVSIYEPPVPLTFVQSMNTIQIMAKASDCQLFFIMHDDAEIECGMTANLIENAKTEYFKDDKFGAGFTNYDALAAFSTKAVSVIGPWDQIFTQYWSDNDYYGRIKKCGFKIVDNLIPSSLVKHHTSSTIKANSRLSLANSILFEAYEKLYRTCSE